MLWFIPNWIENTLFCKGEKGKLIWQQIIADYMLKDDQWMKNRSIR